MFSLDFYDLIGLVHLYITFDMKALSETNL